MMSIASLLFQRALSFAVERHAAVRQARKGTDFPYGAHPIRVAEILNRFDYENAVVVAGFLHDLIEDARVGPSDISARFGPRVTSLVEAASEEDRSADWCTRKERTIAKLAKETRPAVLALVAADKLDNVRSIAETLRRRGEQTWTLFNAGAECQAWYWYYRSIARTLLAKSPDDPLFRALDEETRALFPADDARDGCPEGCA